MRLIFLISFASLLTFSGFAQNQYGGKPQYDILVRQYPDTFGTFRIELYPTVCPLHTENFDTLARQGFYDSLAFHRVVSAFVIQGGDPNSKTGPPSTWGQGAPWQQNVPAEFSPIPHVREIIGAARGNNINSATSQFYVNLVTNSHLDGLYTAYGRVISGMNVVDSVEAVPVDPNDLPLSKVDMFVNYVGTDSTIPAQAPTLSFPADAATNISRTTVFSWNAVSPVDFILYKIQFSKQSDFSSIEFEKYISNGTTAYAPADSLELGYVTYYWRVMTDNGGNQNISATRSFTTGIEAPIPLSPANDAAGVFLNTYIDWDHPRTPSEYRLIVSKVPVLSIPAQNVVDTIVGQSVFLTPELEANRPYYWGVAAIDNGVEGDFSPLWKFTTGSTVNSILDENESQVRIFPNPSEGYFKIVAKGDQRFSIIDVRGKSIKKGEFINEALIDASQIPSGSYFVRLSDRDSDQWHRIQIK